MNEITNQSATLQQATNSTASIAAANYLNRKPQTMQEYSQRGDCPVTGSAKSESARIREYQARKKASVDIANTKDKLIAELHAEIERLTSALATSEQHRQMLWDEMMWGSDSDKE